VTKSVIAATGLFTPEQSISNAELVEAYNSWAAQWNADHANEIQEGDVAALTPSSVEFIEKASGIKSRFVLDKAGVLDPTRMAPNIAERPNEDLSVMAEMAVAAARQAIAAWGKPVSEIGAVLCAASNMPRPYPALAIEVQQALGIQGFAFDMNVACSSATVTLPKSRVATTRRPTTSARSSTCATAAPPTSSARPTSTPTAASSRSRRARCTGCRARTRPAPTSATSPS